MVTQSSTASIRGRMHYLDSLRGFIMTFGVILHASLWSGVHHWLPASIAFVSSLFRMKMFALLAGYFAALIISKRGMSYAVKERAVRFGVPALVFVLIFNPITIYLWYTGYRHQQLEFFSFTAGNFAADGEQEAQRAWHLHIWFLIILAVYAFMLPLLAYLANRRVVENLLVRVVALPHWLCLLVQGVALSGLFVAGRLIHFATTQQLLHGGPYNYLAQTFFCYLPFFFYGMLVFRFSDMFKVLHKVEWIQAVASFLLLWAVSWYENELVIALGFPLSEAIRHFCSSLAGFYICCILLSLFSRYLGAKNRVGDFMSRASYSVYLFHMLVLVLVQEALDASGIHGLNLYFASIPIAYGACLLLHVYVVERSAFLGLLLNGKLPKPEREPVLVA
jgi:glucan biosynthesis protein C